MLLSDENRTICIESRALVSLPLTKFLQPQRRPSRRSRSVGAQPSGGTLSPATAAVESAPTESAAVEPAATEPAAMKPAAEALLTAGGKTSRCASVVEAAKGTRAHAWRAIAESASAALARSTAITNPGRAVIEAVTIKETGAATPVWSTMPVDATSPPVHTPVGPSPAESPKGSEIKTDTEEQPGGLPPDAGN